MTAERLEIIAGSGRLLNSLILTSEGKERIRVEGDFLSNGTWYMPLAKVKKMLELKIKAKYRRGYELKYIPYHKSYSK